MEEEEEDIDGFIMIIGKDSVISPSISHNTMPLIGRPQQFMNIKTRLMAIAVLLVGVHSYLVLHLITNPLSRILTKYDIPGLWWGDTYATTEYRSTTPAICQWFSRAVRHRKE